MITWFKDSCVTSLKVVGNHHSPIWLQPVFKFWKKYCLFLILSFLAGHPPLYPLSLLVRYYSNQWGFASISSHCLCFACYLSIYVMIFVIVTKIRKVQSKKVVTYHVRLTCMCRESAIGYWCNLAAAYIVIHCADSSFFCSSHCANVDDCTVHVYRVSILHNTSVPVINSSSAYVLSVCVCRSYLERPVVRQLRQKKENHLR